jgi:WD40 repeat protein
MGIYPPQLINIVCITLLLLLQHPANGFQASRVEAIRPDENPRLVVPLGHSQSINAVAFSRDGKYIVTGGRDPAVILWEASSGVEIRRFPFTGAVTTSTPPASLRLPVEITSLAFSPDGRRILAGANDKVARLCHLDRRERI